MNEFNLINKSISWLEMLALSILLCILSTFSYAETAVKPIPDSNITLTIKSTSPVKNEYYITSGRVAAYNDSLVPMGVNQDSNEFSYAQFTIVSSQRVKITFSSDDGSNFDKFFDFTPGIYFVGMQYKSPFFGTDYANLWIQKWNGTSFGNDLLKVRKDADTYVHAFFRTNGTSGIRQTVEIDRTESAVKQISIPNGDITFSGRDLFDHPIVCTDPFHCRGMTRKIDVGGYGNVTLTNNNGVDFVTKTIKISPYDQFVFSGNAHSLRATHTRLNIDPDEIQGMLDDWMDDRWSNESPQPLIQAINSAGLNISEVETMLLNGRQIYPTTPEPKGVITANIPIDAEHVDHSSEYVIYVPTSYDKTIQTPIVVIGHGGSVCRDLTFAESAARSGMAPWESFAEQNGFLLVAPLTDRGWGSIGYSIIFSTISQIKRDYNIDPNRVYITGHSMGGHLAFRSGIYLGDRWAATSPMSGGWDYVDSGLVENLFNIPGFATWGERDIFDIEKHNRKISNWMVDHGFLWKNWEKPGGGHSIFTDFIDDVGNMFISNKRDLYRKTVFAGAGPWDAPGGLDISMLEFDTPNHATCWGVTHNWDSQRPIPASTFHWLRLTPANDASTSQKVWAANKGNNAFDITSENARELRLYLHPNMVDFDKPVKVKVNGHVIFNSLVKPDLATLLNLVREFDDRGRIFYAAIDLTIDTDLAPFEPSYYDINNDGCIDRSDLSIIISNIRSPGPHNIMYDLNGNGKVNIADARFLVNKFSNPRGLACN